MFIRQAKKCGDITLPQHQSSTVNPDDRPNGPIGDPIPKSFHISIVQELFIKLNDKLAPLDDVEMFGQLQWYREKQCSEQKVLRNIITDEIFAGAAIGRGPKICLFACMFSSTDKHMYFHPIRLTEKQQNQIKNLKLLSEGQAT